MLDTVFRANNITPAAVMASLVQPCDEIMIKCRWQGKMVPCKEIFDSSLTYFGSCCSFNSNNRMGSVAFDVANSSAKYIHLFGRRTNLYGYLTGLSVAISPMIEPNAYTSAYSRGIRTIIHDASIYPSYTNIEKQLEIGSEVFVKMTATESHCSEAVRDLPQSSRQCLFEDELQLRYARFLTLALCNIVTEHQRAVGLGLVFLFRSCCC